MPHVWEVMRRPGATGADWNTSLHRSKARAFEAVAVYLKQGYTIAGPYRRTVY